MYRLGHYGVALLAYGPVGYLLGRADAPALAILGGALVVALATLPDVDRHVPGLSHRGSTHTVGFALLVGASLAAAAAFVRAFGVSAPEGLAVGTTVGDQLPGGSMAVAFLVGTIAICSHLVADAITPSGVRPFWPVSSRRYALALVSSADPVANRALFAVAVAVTALIGTTL